MVLLYAHKRDTSLYESNSYLTLGGKNENIDR